MSQVIEDFAQSYPLPAPGHRNYTNGMLHNVGYYGFSWSSAVNGDKARYLDFYYNGISPQANSHRTYCFPVRCLQE